MLTSFIQEVRIWPAVWRRRLHYYRLVGAKETLGVVAMVALPILAIGSIVYFAYTQRGRVEPVQYEAAAREAARAQQRSVDLRCLAENVYFEARGEPLDGQYAVAEVTLNRSRSKYFPRTVCGVVHQSGWDPIRRRHVAHFSWTELGPLSPQDGVAWKQAMAVAKAAYDNTYMPVVPGALFYHATSINPTWARSKRTVATIGNHIFYR
jgi:N-acetylmuramoyl-L-alanine amidase